MSEETTSKNEHQNGFATAEQLCGGGVKRRYRNETLPISKLTVRIRSLSEGEMGDYQAKLTRASRGGGMDIIASALKTANRRLIVLCLVDAQGNQILRNNHIGAMSDWDAADVNYLYTACAEHCGVSRDDIEELVKNSAGTPAGSPGSA